jgi:hypothetical protein
MPAARLSLLATALALMAAPAAQAGDLEPHALIALKSTSLAVPAEGQVAVAVGRGGRFKVRSAPAGVTVAGGAKGGRFAVAVVRPRGVAATGKVVLSVRGRGVKTFPAALGGGSAGAACKTLGKLLGKRLKGAGDVRGLGAVLAARLCGRPAPAGADALLARLGLGARPAGSSAPGPGGIVTPRPGGGGGTTPPPSGGGRPCDNGADDDGDGQVDWADPGCLHAGDPSETGEVPVSAECAASSGPGQSGGDPTQLFVGINSGCGTFIEVTVNAAPGAESCQAVTSEGGWECTVFAPLASASGKTPTDLLDMPIQLTGPAECDQPVTIALYRSGGEVAELIEPIGGCVPGAVKPACGNGRDDDGDGTADARDAAGATDPDPGCSGPNDTSEDSEQPLPDTCDIGLGTFDEDITFQGISVAGCGTIAGAWFLAPGTPLDCSYKVGAGAVSACEVKGRTVGATFAASSGPLLMAAHLTTAPICGPTTVALLRTDGTVAAGRGRWC